MNMNTESNNLQLPLPDVSAAIHAALERMRQQNPAWPPVPVPLILSGAAFSTATAIRQRWRETLVWAESHGCMDVLLRHYVAPHSGMDVANQLSGVDDDGNGWWPDTSHWNTEPRATHTSDEVRNAIHELKANWLEVAGESLCSALDPVEITGPKSRRLVVMVLKEVSPPWGSWESVSSNPGAFRDFRHRVNVAIAPLEVDHIDFVIAPTFR
jgi:hypothetical protein